MKKNSFIKSSLCIAAFSCLNLSACNNYYFDSSIAPEDQQVLVENVDKKKNKQKPARKTAKNTSTKTPVKKQNTNNSTQAGVVKPYVTDEPVKSDTQGTLLPTINGFKAKEPKSVLNTISIKDVVNGTVDLNEINSSNSSNKQDQSLNLPEDSAFTLDNPDDGKAQDYSQIVQTDNTVKEEAEVEIVNSLGNNLTSLSTSSGSDKCGTVSISSASATAYKIVRSQATRLQNEVGPIYIAPTVIPDDLSDCVTDLSGVIRQALAQSGVQTVSSSGIAVSQNSGSSSMIPSLVRACRQAGIPLINVSVIRHIGPKVVINIRNMRAKDGITLVQNTTQL
ncbi:MAG: hypothetical protein ACI4UM_07725 [Succinivibrio sp.]